jgi:formate hydrogenlyase subunit 4
MNTVANNVIQILVVLTLPPLLQGVVNRTKALFSGRTGPPLLQLYYDLNKLFRKDSVFSTTTTWVFRAGPVVGLATAILATLFIPMAGSTAPVSFVGDPILMAYMLGLSRFFTTSAALDTGSPFEGMGAAREVTYACLAEPALFLGLLVVASLSGSLELANMFGALAPHWQTAGASLALVVVSWLIVLLVENSRIPFDDPNTHLELTMIHEVIVLDHGGPALGMILYGAAIKLFLFGALVVRLLLPATSAGPWLDWPLFIACMLLLAVVVGVLESTMARLRLTHIPVLLVAAGLLSTFGFVLLMK